MKFLGKEFYFIRHGESEFNANPHLDESVDYSLTQRGRKQAEAMQPVIAKLPIQNICVSPLKRAIETKDIVTQNLNCNVFIIDELSECSFDIWTKMMELERDPKSLPSCKFVRRFMEQAVEGINRALLLPGPVLIVAHGGIHWAMCHHMQVVNYEKKIDNCIPAHFRFCDNFSKWEAKHLAKPSVQ